MGKSSNIISDTVRSLTRKHLTSSNEPSAGNSDTILPVSNQDVSRNTSINQIDGLASNIELTSNEKNLSANVTSKHGDNHAQSGNGHIMHAQGNSTQDSTIQNTPPPAPPPTTKSEAEISGNSTIENGSASEQTKPSFGQRTVALSKNFYALLKHAICSSWVNWLLICAPAALAVGGAKVNPSVVFALNALAIIPLAGLLAFATESVASRAGHSVGALLNITFGNAVELIIFIIALTKNEIRIVQAALIGSILANLLLILGMAFLIGGLRFREQIYNKTVTQTNSVVLVLSVGAVVLPVSLHQDTLSSSNESQTAFHFSFNADSVDEANSKILQVSRGSSVVLLLVYGLYLLFQLKSHSYLYQETPQAIIDEESRPGILGEILNSSSSSSSDDDTDGGSSSDSSTSRGTTAKRIRRLIKNRRRRKSSASNSTAGTISSPPSFDHRENYFDGRSQQSSGRASPLDVIVSGDEADADAEDGRHGTRVRGFVSLDAETNKSHRRKKVQRKQKKKHRKAASRDDSNGDVLHSQDKSVQLQEPVEPVEPVEVVKTTTEPVAKRPFNVRGLSQHATTIRPGLSKMLSNTVFATPQPQAQPSAIARIKSESALRRTTSLPDRLNQNQPSDADLKVTNFGNLPPYQVRRIPTPKAALGTTDTEDEDEEEEPATRLTSSVLLLLLSTGLTAACANFMVDAIPEMIGNSSVGEAFIGLIILPIVGNAAEHFTAVTVAAKNKMDLAIGVSIGSSIQIALFITPFIVLLGWCLNVEMSLYFSIFETVSLIVAVFICGFLCLDGRSNYLEGVLLIACYIIIAVGAFFYPDTSSQSAMGSGNTSRSIF